MLTLIVAVPELALDHGQIQKTRLQPDWDRHTLDPRTLAADISDPVAHSSAVAGRQILLIRMGPICLGWKEQAHKTRWARSNSPVGHILAVRHHWTAAGSLEHT